jgi:hypothetical protein
MANQTQLILQPVSAWLAQVLRLTAFYCQDQEFEVSGWWAGLTGSSPEKETNHLKIATRIVEGPFEQCKLILQKNPAVIDVRLQPNETTPYQIESIPVVGRFDEEYEDFIALGKKLFNIQGFPLIKRLAFGAVLNLSARDHERALEQLAPYIKSIKIDPASSRDFLYQINRRRPFRLEDSESFVNRLSKWSVVSYHSLMAGTPLVTSETRHASQLELDISTSQDFAGVLPPEQVGAIFEKLVSMGIEIIAQGDIP